MYIFLQFFTLLAAYSGWRGYVRGERRFQIIAILAIGAAIMSHQEGAALLVAVPVAILSIFLIRRNRNFPWKSIHNLVGVIFLLGVSYFIIQYDVPDHFRAISIHGGDAPDRQGWVFGLEDWREQLVRLETVLPYGLSLLPVALIYPVKAFRRRALDSNTGTTYVLAVLILLMFAVLVVIKTPQLRFWLYPLPFYALVLWQSLTILSDYIIQAIKGTRSNYLPAVAFPILLVAGVAANQGVLSGEGDSVTRPLIRVKSAYGPVCQWTASKWWCNETAKNYYRELRGQIQPGDLVLTTNPWVTTFYIGQVDGFVREQRDSDGFSIFESPTDEYFGTQLVDHLDELYTFLEGDQKVWLLVDPKAGLYSSNDTRNFIREMFERHSEGLRERTYVNCEEPPCLSYSSLLGLTEDHRYQEGINPDPEFSQTLVDRAILLTSQEEFGRALAFFSRALVVDPLNSEVYSYRGAFYAVQREYREALKDLAAAITINPKSSSAHIHRGEVYLELGLNQRALEDFGRAI